MKGVDMYPDKKTKTFFYLFIPIIFISQTSYDIQDFLGWFSTTLLPMVTPLFIFIVIIMFVFAILKAPLDVLRKGMAKTTALLLLVLLLVGETGWDAYVYNVASTLGNLLTIFLVLVLPMIFILLLYRTFMFLVRGR